MSPHHWPSLTAKHAPSSPHTSPFYKAILCLFLEKIKKVSQLSHSGTGWQIPRYLEDTKDWIFHFLTDFCLGGIINRPRMKNKGRRLFVARHSQMCPLHPAWSRLSLCNHGRKHPWGMERGTRWEALAFAHLWPGFICSTDKKITLDFFIQPVTLHWQWTPSKLSVPVRLLRKQNGKK